MSDPLVTITVGSHFFRLNRIHPRAYEAIYSFIKPLVERGFIKVGRKFLFKPLRVFSARTKDKAEYRFHRNQLDKFLNHLDNYHIGKHLRKVVELPYFDAEPIDVSLTEEITLRDYQEEAVDYITDLSEGKISKLVPLPTGTGKTVVECAAISRLGERTIVIVKPQYIPKWINDLHRLLNIDTKLILPIRGSKALQAFIDSCLKDECEYPFIIISNRTMLNWIKDYEVYREETKSLGYNIYPEDLFKVAKAGHRLIDEVHQEFHCNYRLDLYTHCNSSTSLSATLMNNNPFLERMYEIAYPLPDRYQAKPPKKYIDAYALLYHLNPFTKVRTEEYGSTIYSHTAFEKSIIRNPRLMQNYWLIIKDMIEKYFLEKYKVGDRLAVFASTIAMCTELTARIDREFGEFDVRRYVEDDPDENLYESDIRVTTILSGGTAHDIAKLKTVILTVAVDSIQSNIQTLGRLRELENDTPIFVYLSCVDVPKHVDYHKRKFNMLQHRAKSVQQIYSQRLL